jgi:hypothetical protein
MAFSTSKRVAPCNVYCKSGSKAERISWRRRGGEVPSPAAKTAGIVPQPELDLVDRGGKVIHDLTYKNFFVGGDSAWSTNDIANIDKALADVMTDPGLNNVIVQYLRGAAVGTTVKPSTVLPGAAAAVVSQGDIEGFVLALQKAGRFDGFPLESTVFNFMLPSGTVLTIDEPPAQHLAMARQVATAGHAPTIPIEDEASSLAGLGGFHGSVHGARGGQASLTIYYAVGAFSEVLADGRQNGIVVFPEAWKNVVATFYHELCEARTDPDVGDAIRNNDDRFLGWSSPQGQEIGDIPINVAGNDISKVILEIKVGNGDTVPVQLQWSNFVDGPEGPSPTPRPLA